MNEIKDKLKEAVLYCEDALFYLNEAENSVDSAKGWGISSASIYILVYGVLGLIGNYIGSKLRI